LRLSANAHIIWLMVYGSGLRGEATTMSFSRAAIIGLALFASFRPMTSTAQTVPTVGYLTNAGADPVRLADVKSALTKFGYVDGKNIIIEVRGAKSNSDYDVLAAELVARHVNIILGVNATATNAQTTGWLGGDTDLRAGNNCSAASAEERSLFQGASAAFVLIQPAREVLGESWRVDQSSIWRRLSS